LRAIFWNQRRKYGAILQSALLWARTPKLLFGVVVLYGMIDRRSSPIEPALRSLVTVRVAQINCCAFCVDLNAATLLKRGMSSDKVRALECWRASVLFDQRQQTILAYADAMTRSDLRVDDALMERLRTLITDDAVLELARGFGLRSAS
jgi:AhpD family alkylhydroperoxidase